MKTHNTPWLSRLLKLLVLTSASLASALGMLVIVGWHTHNQALIPYVKESNMQMEPVS
jgi:hypothetical protein